MAHRLSINILICILCLLPVAWAEESGIFGAGAGPLYNGLGLNLHSSNDSTYKYIAVGCVGFGKSSSSDEVPRDCGVGVGVQWIGLFADNDHHGLGGHLAVTDKKNDHAEDYNGTAVLLGLSYSYFFNGPESRGWNFSVAPYIGKYGDETDTGILVGPGFQF